MCEHNLNTLAFLLQSSSITLSYFSILLEDFTFCNDLVTIIHNIMCMIQI